MDRARLLAAHVELRAYLLAQEDWHPSYRTDPRAFRMLARAEARMQSNVREYLRGLPSRLGKLINWEEVYRRMAAKKPDVTVTVSGGWTTEADLLTVALMDPITDAMVAGTMVAEANTGVTSGMGIGNATILQAAREHTADLVKGLNATTRDQVSQAIRNGLAQHEDVQEITRRVSETVDDPARAELIARTEAVRAATHGQLLLAEQIGAQFKVWQDGQAGECPVCLSVRPKRIPVAWPFGDDFPEGPPAHPRCRCGLSLDFATPEEAAALADGTYVPEEFV